MNTSILETILVVAALAATGACATQGRFEGRQSPDARQAAPPTAPAVPFVWNSTDGGMSGEIAATLADGESFAGTFESDVQQAARPRTITWYDAWRSVWDGHEPGFDPSDTYPGLPYVDVDIGRVFAELHGSRGTTMRCSFLMDHADAGLHAGARGHCELSDGGGVDATFSRQPLAHRQRTPTETRS